MGGSSCRAISEPVALAWLALVAGRKRARALLAEEGTPQAALARLEPRPTAFVEFLRSLESHSYQLLTHDSPLFPPLLREIPDPPLLLYASGDSSLLQCPGVAVVGARRCSRSGAEIARVFARDLAALGFNVVSGLAMGIDAAAHRGALQGGRTVAVLGAGLGRIYPLAHRALAAEIIQAGGLLVSEYPPLWSARSFQFPERNRLISGLSLGVVVVEAGEQSGSLITARLALEQGRDVMAVPGSINNPVARGCHRLLRQGAALVETVADVVEVLGCLPISSSSKQIASVPSPGPVSAELAGLLDQLGSELATFDELCAGAEESPEIIAARLTELELGGFVEQVPGGYIRRAFREA